MDSAEVSTPTADSDEQLKQKRKRLSISLETKETIIQECELALQENISFRKLAKKWEMNPQTLSHIWKSREKILELVQRRNKKPPLSANSPLKNKLQRTPTKEVSLTNGTSGVHTSMLTSIDNVLITWVDEQIARDIIVTKAKLCDMAKLLYSNYERKLNPNEECKFEADTSWFRGFMKRFKIKSKLKELVAQKAKYDDKPTCEFIAKFEQTVSKEKYLPEQIFTVDEIGFKWKINGNFQEQVILLLGGNASGDFKLKPLMINYTEAPRALFHVLRNTLPVTYRSNKALRMNNDIFTKWFRKCFCPQVKDYLASKNIEYKVLLLIDSVPAHSKTLSFGKKVNVLSIPPLVSCKIHPMVNSDLRNAFRDAYLKRAMKMAKNYLDSAVKEEKKSELIDFWKSFNIKHCIELVGQAWNEDVTRGLMVNAWKKMYPSNPSTVTEISTLTTMEHLNDERLKNAFDPLRNTYTDDLIDYFEIHSDLIEQYMAGDVQQQLRNGNNVDEYSFTSSPAISELSTTSLTTFRQQSSNLLKRQLKTQPFTSQSSTSSSVSSFPTTTISSVSTSESVSHARKQTSNSMKRPLLKQALLNGSKSVKLNGHVVNSIGSLQQNGISSNGAKDASKMELASKESNDLSPVMRAESDALSRKLNSLMGRDRFLLLLRVINLPEHKVNFARKIMRLVDSDGCDGGKLSLATVAEHNELLTVLLDNYSNLQVKKENELSAKPNVFPFQNSKSHFDSFINSNDFSNMLQNSFPNFSSFASTYLNADAHQDSCPRLGSLLKSLSSAHSHENSQLLENESSIQAPATNV